ncbi:MULTISPECIES: hypothetical protein [unclassified Paraburkholderia]|uniref:hypothetical protein n=1 Tax=unclassified Paraburkholderia TaxID=2615204 RepID=UPI0038BA4DB5
MVTRVSLFQSEFSTTRRDDLMKRYKEATVALAGMAAMFATGGAFAQSSVTL